MSSPDSRLYFIGYSRYEFGLGEKSNILKLPECPNKTFNTIFCGHSYNIFSDSNELKNVWAAGANYDGECGVGQENNYISKYAEIEYFKENCINISKIFINPDASATFFLSDTNKIYACGRDIDRTQQLKLSSSEYSPSDIEYVSLEPIYIPQLQNVIDIKSNGSYIMALCGNINEHILVRIIQNWCRQHQIPQLQDIINLLLLFTKSTAIYATSESNTLKESSILPSVSFLSRSKYDCFTLL